MSKVDVSALAGLLVDVASSSRGRKFICGTYSDGKPRSVIDAFRDEYISPQDRARWDEIKKKKKKKKKKKGKKKGKHKKVTSFWDI